MNKTRVMGIGAAGIALGAFAWIGNRPHERVSGGFARSGAFTGYVTDLKCKRKIDAACNKLCFDAGAQPALLVDGTGDILRLNHAEAVKYPGTHVEIEGTRENDVLAVSIVRAM